MLNSQSCFIGIEKRKRSGRQSQHGTTTKIPSRFPTLRRHSPRSPDSLYTYNTISTTNTKVPYVQKLIRWGKISIEYPPVAERVGSRKKLLNVPQNLVVLVFVFPGPGGQRSGGGEEKKTLETFIPAFIPAPVCSSAGSAGPFFERITFLGPSPFLLLDLNFLPRAGKWAVRWPFSNRFIKSEAKLEWLVTHYD
jgi:hypothetical protein